MMMMMMMTMDGGVKSFGLVSGHSIGVLQSTHTLVDKSMLMSVLHVEYVSASDYA